MTTFKLIIFITLLLLTSNVFAAPPKSITLHANTSQALLAPFASFHKDLTGGITLKEILDDSKVNFSPLTKKDINQGFSDETFWVNLQLANPNMTDIEWVISHETTYIDVMNVYYRTGNSDWLSVAVSDHDDFSLRSEPYRRLNYSNTTNAKQSTEVYIELKMIDKDALTLGLRLQSKQSFNNYKSDEQFFYGVYFGIIFTLILISLIFSLQVKQKLYFAYTVYLFMHLVFWGFLTGYIFQYIIPNFPDVYNQGFNIVFLLFFISALQFSKLFLNTALYSPKIHKVLCVLQLFSIFAIFLRLIGVYGLVVYISHLSLLSLALLPIVGWLSYRKGLKYARWYIFAWVIFGTGILLSVLSASTSLFDWGMEPILYTQIFSLFESFLLLVALADKVNQVNKDLIVVKHEAQQDSLTRLGNRRLLQARFKQMMLPSSQNKSYWCLVLDIDDFKLLNDKHGHAFGDEVLKKLACIFKKLCRPEDLVVRYGGEEFVILIESSDVNIVKYIAERIRMNVEATVLEHKHLEIRTTISIGISKIDLDKNKTFEWSFNNADKALYHVKNASKNGVALFEGGEITNL